MSVYNTATESADASNDEQASLWTYGEAAAERSEDWLPRTGECDCNRIHCFHKIDWDQLNERNKGRWD